MAGGVRLWLCSAALSGYLVVGLSPFEAIITHSDEVEWQLMHLGFPMGGLCLFFFSGGVLPLL